MSLEDLLAEEPPVTLMRQRNPGLTDGGGVPLHSLTDVCQIQGRVIRGNARQREAWSAALGVQVDAQFLTQYAALQNGDFIQLQSEPSTPGGRIFRVVGVANETYAKGGIPAHFNFPLEENRLV